MIVLFIVRELEAAGRCLVPFVGRAQCRVEGCISSFDRATFCLKYGVSSSTLLQSVKFSQAAHARLKLPTKLAWQRSPVVIAHVPVGLSASS
jgi:hypothetical protein